MREAERTTWRHAWRRWRASTAAVMRHEARLLAYAPMTAVFLAGFLLSTAAAVFLVGDFYASDVASADLLWTFLPWAALVFVPALAMNAFPDAPGDRSLELVCSLPLPRSSIVAGKWLAGTGILTLALAGTLPFAATIAYLGAPDWGVMAAGYLAALLLVASFFAVALAASACAREPIAAYVLGVGALFVILAAGWDVAGRYARGSALEPLLSFAAGLSPKLWLDRAATGRLELGAILAAALLVAGALAISRWALEVRGGARLGQTLTPPALAAAAVLLLLAALVPKLAGGAAHLDLTAEREFTLHAESVAVAREVPPGTVVDFYWSSREASVPASIRLHARRARDLLRGLAASSGGRLRLVEHDVEPDSDEETRALAAGVRRIALSAGGSFVLGAAVHQGARKTSISYFDIGRDRLLEHDIAAALAGLTRGRTPRVAVISPLLLPRNIEQPREGLAIIEELKRTYDTAIVPHFADKLPDDLDAVIVIGASILKRSMLHAIDQHVMRGKGLIVLADPFNRFNQASDAVVPEPSPEVNDISDLLAAWGLTFDGKAVIGDRQLAAQVAGDGERQLAYPFWLQVRKAGLSARHRATAGLAEVLFVEPGAWEITRAGAAEPLVSTTAAAGAQARTDASGKSVEELAAAFEPDGRVRVLAAAIVGPLASAFTAAPDDAPPGSPPHLTRSPASVPVFAVADVDWLFDPAAFQSSGGGDRNLARPLNDNATLFSNLVEIAAGDARLLAIRSRGSQQRPFTTVAAMLAAAQERYREEEREAVQRIAKVEGDIAKVLSLAQVRDVEQLPREIRERIEALRAALAPHRQKLRALRAAMREDIERLGARLTALNLAAPVLLALAFAAAMRRLRRRAIPPSAS